MKERVPAPGRVRDPQPQRISEREDSVGKRGAKLQAGHASAGNISPSQAELNPAASVAERGARNPLPANNPGKLQVVPRKLPVGSGTTAPLAGVIRSRTAATVSLGGAASPTSRNSLAGINGATMKRKF